jgi:exopolysaccharide biosynthesis protein
MTRGALNVGGRRVPYFGGNWARAVGWLVCDGTIISAAPAEASLVVRADGRVEFGRYAQLPREARQVVSGSQQILTGGRVTARGGVRAPRTAAGLNADASRLTLLVVDGRLLAHSAGMSEVELAEEMLRLGCTDALNLDGGGSSTLVLRDPPDAPAPKLMNRPSDGHDLAVPLSIERSVACVLGVRVARNAEPTTAPAKEERP